MFNKTIHGDWHSDDYRYVEIKLDKCDAVYAAKKGITCADPNEITAYLKGKQIRIFYTDTYTDIGDATNTVKLFLERRLRFPVMKDYSTDIEFFLQPVQERVSSKNPFVREDYDKLNSFAFGQKEVLTSNEVSEG